MLHLQHYKISVKSLFGIKTFIIFIIHFQYKYAIGLIAINKGQKDECKWKGKLSDPLNYKKSGWS